MTLITATGVLFIVKKYLHHEYDKKPAQCVLFGTSPITVCAHVYLIATERSHIHKVIRAVSCYQPLPPMT